MRIPKVTCNVVIHKINTSGLDAFTLEFPGGDEDGKVAVEAAAAFSWTSIPRRKDEVRKKKNPLAHIRTPTGHLGCTASARHEPTEQENFRRCALARRGPPWLSLVDPSRADEAMTSRSTPMIIPSFIRGIELVDARRPFSAPTGRVWPQRWDDASS